jgi:hypothetical protein
MNKPKSMKPGKSLQKGSRNQVNKLSAVSATKIRKVANKILSGSDGAGSAY